MFLTSLLATLAYSLPQIEIKGGKFFQQGNQFQIKGIAYQPGGSGRGDPLANVEGCRRDVPILKELGVNVIRVYEVYNHFPHDECMRMLNENGIYLLLDLPVPDHSINRDTPTYDSDLFDYFAQKVDLFRRYDNVLGFFAGNEVNNHQGNTHSNPFVKAIIRDLKAYQQRTPGRRIPVGYATNDDGAIRNQIKDYFNCGSEIERADFYGINIYRWCGQSNLRQAAYDQLTNEFRSYSIPVFFSEYGCNAIRPRNFGDFQALMSTDMIEVFSGGIAYEYSQEPNNYGVVRLLPNNGIERMNDFGALKYQYTQVSPAKSIRKEHYNTTNPPSQCPAVGPGWNAHPNLPRPISKERCDCMMDALECRINPQFRIKENGSIIGKKFEFICSNGVNCNDIAQNGLSGQYGVYSSCSVGDKLSWALNQYYFKVGQNHGACTHENLGIVVQPKHYGDCTK